MKALGRLGLALILTLGLSVTAEANTLFDNTSGSVMGPEGFSNGGWGAVAFGPGPQPYQLDQISVWTQAISNSAVATIDIYDSAGDVPGGTVLGTLQRTSDWNTATASATFFQPAAPIILNANTEYWAKFTVSGDVSVGWAYTDYVPNPNLLAATKWASSYDGGAYGTSDLYMLKVEGTSISAVPVPASIWLFASALASYFGVTRRRV